MINGRLVAILALVAAAGIFFGYVNPVWTGSVASTKSEITNYDAALAAATQYQQKQDQLLQEQSAIPADSIARLNHFLPDSVGNVQLILDLDALAARSGVVLSNFDIQDAAAAAGAAPAAQTSTGALSLSTMAYDSLQLSLTATASYSAFRAFLDGVENSERLLDVTGISIAPSTTGVYNYQITLRLYWLR